MNTSLDTKVIDFFVYLAAALKLPRSVGELYGTLFASPDPLSMVDLMNRLEMSKGSASQGLRLLKTYGAVKTVYQQGQRKDFYVAETEVRKLFTGFIKEQVRPHLDGGFDRIADIRSELKQLPPEESARIRQRVDKMEQWYKRAGKLIPLMVRFMKPL